MRCPPARTRRTVSSHRVAWPPTAPPRPCTSAYQPATAWAWPWLQVRSTAYRQPLCQSAGVAQTGSCVPPSAASPLLETRGPPLGSARCRQPRWRELAPVGARPGNSCPAVAVGLDARYFARCAVAVLTSATQGRSTLAGETSSTRGGKRHARNGHDRFPAGPELLEFRGLLAPSRLAQRFRLARLLRPYRPRARGRQVPTRLLRRPLGHAGVPRRPLCRGRRAWHPLRQDGPHRLPDADGDGHDAARARRHL